MSVVISTAAPIKSKRSSQQVKNSFSWMMRCMIVGIVVCVAIGFWMSTVNVKHFVGTRHSNQYHVLLDFLNYNEYPELETLATPLDEKFDDAAGAFIPIAREKGLDVNARYPPLNCMAYGGPTKEAATQEMVYWEGSFNLIFIFIHCIILSTMDASKVGWSPPKKKKNPQLFQVEQGKRICRLC